MSPPLPHINVEVLVNIPDRQYGVIEVSWHTSTLNKGGGVERINLPNIFDGVCSLIAQAQSPTELRSVMKNWPKAQNGLFIVGTSN